MLGNAEIVVGAQEDDRFTVNRYAGALGGIKPNEVP
jgi:hypothetical protein